MHTNAVLNLLREKIADHSAVVVVGTGVSLAVVKGGGDAAKVAGWQGLLESGLAECLKNGVLSQRMHDAHLAEMNEDGGLDCLLQVATALESALASRPDVKASWLNATIGTLPRKNTDIIDALADLGCPILTTNYDTLIANHLGRNPVPWTNKDQLPLVARGEAPHVLHIHGVYTEPRSVVLGLTSYERVSEDDASTLLKASLAAMKSFIFVGCGVDGLNDPDLGPFFKRYGELFVGGRHFRLCRAVEAASTPHGITPLTYADHDGLLPLLRQLAPAKASPVTAIDTRAAGAAALAPRAARLPEPLHRFLRGRDGELRQAIEWMVARRAFAVIGLAGMGKSALSLEALRSPEVEAAFGERRWFVRLDAVKDANTLLGKIGQEMDLPPDPGRPRVVMDELAEKGGAIVLDNAEDPLKADRAETERVLSELAGLPGVAVAVGVRGTGDLPRIAESLTMRPLGRDDARAVFLDLAGDRFAIDPDLERLLGRMEGMPLPLHLLGRKAKASDAPNIAWLLNALDGDGKRALRLAEGRQYDLAACIGVSVPNKGPLRDLLSLLGQLPDGIGCDDLEALIGKDGRAAAEESVAVGLTFWDYGLNRLRTLAPIREHFARAVKPRSKLLLRCQEFHLDRLEASFGNEMMYPALATQTANVEAMLAPALAAQISDASCRAATAYGAFHRFTGLGRGIVLLERMVARLPPRGRSKVAAHALRELAAWSAKNLDFDLSRQRLEAARRHYRESPSVDGVAACMDELGRLALHTGDLEQAKTASSAALSMARHPGTLGNCEDQLGELYQRQSNLDIASAHISRARHHFQSATSLSGQGNCHGSEAEIAWRRGLRGDMIAATQAALQVYQQISDISGEAHCHLLFALAGFEAGEWSEARRHLQTALGLLKRASNPLYDVDAHVLMARLALAESADVEGATAALAKALAVLDGKQIPRHQAQCLCVQGEIALARGDCPDAVAKFQAALDLYPRHRGDDIAGDCWRGLGDVAARQGEPEAAHQAWTTAIDHYGRFPNPHWIAQVKLRLAKMAAIGERGELLDACRRTWSELQLPYWLAKLDEVASPALVA